ncbi:hypothetical protein F4780DRAFT_629032 [Xylariomycetidae sp. FL0641]|nr:hypothetical protein F4780DRAFT_629032 [Xylariomycetidae sp. FL0641]
MVDALERYHEVRTSLPYQERVQVIFRHLGRYYNFYPHSDEHNTFRRVGSELRSQIAGSLSENRRRGGTDWLDMWRSWYNPETYSNRPSSSKELPSALPVLRRYSDNERDELPPGSLYSYIVNLDEEILTIDYSVHWKFDNIPPTPRWYRPIKPSVCSPFCTIAFSKNPFVNNKTKSPALQLPPPDNHFSYLYTFTAVIAKTDLKEQTVPAKAITAAFMVEVLNGYKYHINLFGTEWSPDSFAFRELSFAILAIASRQAHFQSLEGPEEARRRNINSAGFVVPAGYVDTSTYHGPGMGNPDIDFDTFLEFGQMRHRPGNHPGVSPEETTYWLGDVLVSLVLQIDAKAIEQAVTVGVQEGITNFQVVVMSLFQVAFAEVDCLSSTGRGPLVRFTPAVQLSPLTELTCANPYSQRFHRPLGDGQAVQFDRQDLFNTMERTKSGPHGSADAIRTDFPGIAALVNFFFVAESRRAAAKLSKSKAIRDLPAEVYGLILEHVDYETWKTCSVVSPPFRAACFRKYRLDDHHSIVGGTVEQPRFKVKRTGKVVDVQRNDAKFNDWPNYHYHWFPVVGGFGGQEKAIILDALIAYRGPELPAIFQLMKGEREQRQAAEERRRRAVEMAGSEMDDSESGSISEISEIDEDQFDTIMPEENGQDQSDEHSEVDEEQSAEHSEVDEDQVEDGGVAEMTVRVRAPSRFS